MRTLLLAVLLAVFARPARASSSFSSAGNGTTTADFLNLGVGARAVAMGQAYSAAANDSTAMYWNVGALTNAKGGEHGADTTFMHAPYLASSYFDYLAGTKNFGKNGAAGMSLQYFSLGGLNATDASGNDIGTVSPYDMAISFGYAYPFPYQERDGLSVGMAMKLVQQKIVTSASAFAVDLGLLSGGYFDEKVHFAFTLTNFGTSVKYDGSKEPLPLAVKAGSALKISQKWMVTLDLAAPKGGNPYAAFGSEYRLVDTGPWTFAARAGVNTQTLGSVDGFSGVSMGFGLGYRGGSFDYAFVPLGGLGQAQRLSISFRF